MGIKKKTKLRIYKSNVMSVLLCGAECWKVNQNDGQRLNTFHYRCLRRMLRIFWPRTITNEKLYEEVEISRITDIIKARRWSFIGHILRFENTNDCRIVMNWTPVGKRSIGRPKETWRRMVEKERDAFGWKSWAEAAQRAADRAEWRTIVHALCDTWRRPVAGCVHSMFVISSDHHVVALSPALFIQCSLYRRTIVSLPCLRLCSFNVHYIIGPSSRRPVSGSVHSMFIISSDHHVVALSPALFIQCSLYHRTIMSSPCLRLCSFNVRYIIGPSCRRPVSGSIHSMFIISSDHHVVALSPAVFIQCSLYHRTIVSLPCLRLY